jgi:hypothetical protein
MLCSAMMRRERRSRLGAAMASERDRVRVGAFRSAGDDVFNQR